MPSEKRFTPAPDVPHTRTDVLSILSAIAGALALASFLAPVVWPIYIAAFVGIAGLVLGLRSRKRLQSDPTLGGAGLSAFGFLTSLIALVIIVVRLPELVLGPLPS